VTDDELSDERFLSRRQLITRAAAGAAIAWTTPVLTTLRVPAGAQAGTPPPTTTTIPSTSTCTDPCSADNPCGADPLCDCGTSSIPEIPCVSAITASGCQCVQPFCFDACGGANDPPCPPGFVCGGADCCGAPSCVPLCGTDITTMRARRALRPWIRV
jgi:hypothetical protein